MQNRKRPEIEPTIKIWGDRIKAKMLANSFKPGWVGANPQALFNGLLEELSELHRAMHTEPAENVVKEASDVAAYAMMIADNYDWRISFNDKSKN